jgi:hypothetical protein
MVFLQRQWGFLGPHVIRLWQLPRASSWSYLYLSVSEVRTPNRGYLRALNVSVTLFLESSTFFKSSLYKPTWALFARLTSQNNIFFLVIKQRTFSNDFLTKRTGVVDVNVRSDQINVIEINFLCQNLQHLTFSYLLIFFATFAHQIITNFGGKPSRNRPKVTYSLRPEINVAIVFVSVKLRKYTDTGVCPLGSVRTRLPLCIAHLSISVAEPPNLT